MPVNITISGENAAQAHKEFADLHSLFIGGKDQLEVPIPAQPPVTPQAPVPTQTSAQTWTAPPQQSPYQAPPIVSTQPAPATPPPVGRVPISNPSYTVEQLGVAAGPLVDTGRGPELTAWLQQRGAGALTQLDKAYYGEFATYLRSLGAKI